MQQTDVNHAFCEWMFDLGLVEHTKLQDIFVC